MRREKQMIGIRNGLGSVTDRKQWGARGASFVAKVKATKAVWFPPEPVETGKKVAATAQKTAQKTAKKTTGTAKKATGSATKKSTGAAKKTTKSTATRANGVTKKATGATKKGTTGGQKA